MDTPFDSVGEDEVAALLQRVDELLRAGDPKGALALLDGGRAGDPLLENARGVCLMRAPDPALRLSVGAPMTSVSPEIATALPNPSPGAASAAPSRTCSR